MPPTPDDRANAGEPTPTAAAESTRSAGSAQRPGKAAADGPELARAMGELARELARQPDMEAALKRITAAVVATVPGARYAGITSATGRNRVSARASTASIVDDLDRLQAELGQGPCIAALRGHATISIPDMAGESRWPKFAARAAELGAASMLSLQLYVEQDNLGALNLYATDRNAFHADDETIAQVFAAHTAIALYDAAQSQNLRQAVASRDVIGQAKGLLMNRDQTSAEQAFEQLVGASQHANMKLADVARWLVEEHERQQHR